MVQEEGVDQEANKGVIAEAVFVKDGPKFSEVRYEEAGRNTRMTSVDNLTDWRRPKERVFAEEQGLEDLEAYVKKVIEVADETGHPEMAESARSFLENLTYIGKPELAEAVSGIASHLVEVARSGNDVYIYYANSRSEQYITLLTMEEVLRLTDGAFEIRKRFRISDAPHQIAKSCRLTEKKSLVAILDDFVISGTRIRTGAHRMFSHLVKSGFSPNEAQEMVEANVVAAPTSISIYVGTTNEKPLKFRSYFKIKERHDPQSNYRVSFTGAHCSVDYGFETEIGRYDEFLKKNMPLDQEVPVPLLYGITRPYGWEKDGYIDPGLQERWKKVFSQFYLKEVNEEV